MKSNTRRSIGSILRILYKGLGEAAHSNRTLIWGLDLPSMFEKSRTAWSEGAVQVGDVALECSGWQGLGGGPYACFFEPISSCSLADATDTEISNLALSGYNDSARVSIMGANKRGISSYHVPLALPPYATVFQEHMRHPRHKWAAALAAYAYRLKPTILALFEDRRRQIWTDAGMWSESSDGPDSESESDSKVCADDSCAPGGRTAGPVWGMHVRHGDVQALANVYANRRVFSFSEFFTAARAKAIEVSKSLPGPESEREGGPHPLPVGLFVASDDENTEALLATEETSPAQELWPGGREAAPKVFTVKGSERYRMAHGSHIVGSDGACVGKSCGLPWQSLIYYKSLPSQKAVPVQQRIMRVLLESIEDLYLLSQVDVLLAQMTSHYSTYAGLLSWARTGAADPSSLVYLDEEEVTSGSLHCALMHGGANLEYIKAPFGYQRWTRLSQRFFQGLDASLALSTKSFMQLDFRLDPAIIDALRAAFPNSSFNGSTEFDPSSEPFRMRVVENLPYLPRELFDLEAQRWLGTGAHFVGAAGPAHVWPAECPLRLPGKSESEQISLQVNHGVDHHRTHPGQAALCWLSALGLLSAQGRATMEDAMYDVAYSNLQEVRRSTMFPYSMGPEKVLVFMDLQLGKEGHQMKRVLKSSVKKGA